MHFILLLLVVKEKGEKLNLYESLGGYGYLGLGAGVTATGKKFGARVGSRHGLAMVTPDQMNVLYPTLTS